MGFDLELKLPSIKVPPVQSCRNWCQ